jgi:hypothetical protein
MLFVIRKARAGVGVVNYESVPLLKWAGNISHSFAFALAICGHLEMLGISDVSSITREDRALIPANRQFARSFELLGPLTGRCGPQIGSRRPIMLFRWWGTLRLERLIKLSAIRTFCESTGFRANSQATASSAQQSAHFRLHSSPCRVVKVENLFDT